jgi:putative addiction module CopG family antidote
MAITLNPQTEAEIKRLMETGHFTDASDVVGQALRALEDQEKLTRLRTMLAEADAQIARGEVVDWTPDLMDRLKREAAANVRAGRPIKDEVKP